MVSQVNPGWLKFGTFIVLLPLILFQAAGYRRPIRSERSVGLVFGGGVGVLYSVTTISGPPLAVMLSNQGLTKRDFRAALGIHSAGGVQLHGRRVWLRRAVQHAEHGTHPVHPSQHRDWRPDRRVPHPAHPPGDIPACVYEFRCLDRRLRLVHAPQGSAPRSEQHGISSCSSLWAFSTPACCIGSSPSSCRR